MPERDLPELTGPATTHPLDRHPLDRRRLLLGAGAGAAALALAACSNNSPGSGPGQRSATAAPTDHPTAKPSPTASSSTPSPAAGKGSSVTPLATPAQLHEAPMLTQQVTAKKLPPLAQRIPANPYVVPHHWINRGEYGGTLRMSITDTVDSSVYELGYGHSILRYLNDGTDVGPGLAEKWETNADNTVWTFHFRQGLKWSDGVDWTTADIMYWWDDMVLDPDNPESPPDDVRSGKDTVAKLSAPDANTLKLTFDAPAPVTLLRLAAWVNGPIGPRWMAPKHYIKQFHPKYNSAIKPKGDWATKHNNALLWAQNPKCPTMTGWHCDSVKTGQLIQLVRNPYYYAVNPDGDQLPYIDAVRYTCTQDPEVQKLQFSTGKVDFVQGNHTALGVGDVSTLSKASAGNGFTVRLWDSGSGTGAMTFFNLDTPDAGLRKLFAKKEFRVAMSLAMNRSVARRAVYLQQGQVTTGTVSPKNTVFQSGGQGQQLYRQWRDSAVAHDPAKAKKMLDALGVVDSDGDGLRERPDGSKLTIRLDYPSGSSQTFIQMIGQVKRDWTAIGIKVEQNPIPPTAYNDEWARGQLMVNSGLWVEGTTAPLIDPQVLVPINGNFWAPLYGQAYLLQLSDKKTLTSQRGLSPWKRKPPFLVPEDGTPIGSMVARIWDLFARARVQADALKRLKLEWQIVKIHIQQGPLFYGVVANQPCIIIVHNGLTNVPTRDQLTLGGFTQPWVIPAPACYDPEVFSWDQPADHDV